MQRITITPSQVHDNQIALTTEQRHYLTHVIRLRTGDEFEAIDGTGSCYLAAITAPGAQIMRIAITISQELTQSITLICALPKGNNFDDLVRACTELGVTKIIPAISDRTLLNPSPQKLQRWRKINVFVGSTMLMAVISTLAIAVFSAFLLYDLKQVMDGGETNYISATLAIYLDLFNIFQSLLALLGIFGGDRD